MCRYSLMSVVVIRHKLTLLIQVSFVRSLAVPQATYLGGNCKITLITDGNVHVFRYPKTGHDFSMPLYLSVATDFSSITINFLQSGMQVNIKFWNSLVIALWECRTFCLQQYHTQTFWDYLKHQTPMLQMTELMLCEIHLLLLDPHFHRQMVPIIVKRSSISSLLRDFFSRISKD